MLEGLRALQLNGEPDLLAELIGLYVCDAPRYIASMRAAIAVGDAPTLRKALHAFKGSSANIGATVLAAMCEELEAQARDSISASAADRLADIENEYRRVVEALRELVA